MVINKTIVYPIKGTDFGLVYIKSNDNVHNIMVNNRDKLLKEMAKCRCGTSKLPTIASLIERKYISNTKYGIILNKNGTIKQSVKIETKYKTKLLNDSDTLPCSYSLHDDYINVKFLREDRVVSIIDLDTNSIIKGVTPVVKLDTALEVMDKLQDIGAINRLSSGMTSPSSIISSDFIDIGIDGYKMVILKDFFNIEYSGSKTGHIIDMAKYKKYIGDMTNGDYSKFNFKIDDNIRSTIVSLAPYEDSTIGEIIDRGVVDLGAVLSSSDRRSKIILSKYGEGYYRINGKEIYFYYPTYKERTSYIDLKSLKVEEDDIVVVDVKRTISILNDMKNNR